MKTQHNTYINLAQQIIKPNHADKGDRTFLLVPPHSFYVEPNTWPILYLAHVQAHPPTHSHKITPQLKRLITEKKSYKLSGMSLSTTKFHQRRQRPDVQRETTKLSHRLNFSFVLFGAFMRPNPTQRSEAGALKSILASEPAEHEEKHERLLATF